MGWNHQLENLLAISTPLSGGFSGNSQTFNRWHSPKETRSSEKRAPGWLGYIRDYTTQLYGDYNKPNYKDPW